MMNFIFYLNATVLKILKSINIEINQAILPYWTAMTLLKVNIYFEISSYVVDINP